MAEDTTRDGTAAEPQPSTDESPAQRVISAFGGIRPMATKLQVPVSTVQGWKSRGVIPELRHEELRAAAATHGIPLDEADLASDAGRPAPEETGSEETGPEKAAPQEAAPQQVAPGAGDTAPAADAPAPAGEREPPSPRRRSGAEPPAWTAGRGWLPGFVLGALVLALGAGGAVLTRGSWGPPEAVDGAATDPAVAGLSVHLDELDSRLADLEARPAGGEAPALEGLATVAQLDRQSEALADLQAALSRLESGVSQGAGGADELKARMSGQEAALTSLESRLSQGVGGAEELKARMDGQEASLADLEARFSQGAGGAEELKARMGGLESSLDALGSSAAAALRDEIASLIAKLTEAETRLADADSQLESLIAREQAARTAAARQATASLAVAQLRDAMHGAGPYTAQFEVLNALAADDPELQGFLGPLAARAASGIPTLERLRASFPEVASRVVAAGRDAEQDGVLGDVLRRLSGVISIRPIGEVEGTDADAIVARAEARLADGNLAAAVTELNGLEGAAQRQAADWLGEAQARLDAEGAITKMTGRLAAGLSGG